MELHRAAVLRDLVAVTKIEWQSNAGHWLSVETSGNQPAYPTPRRQRIKNPLQAGQEPTEGNGVRSLTSSKTIIATRHKNDYPAVGLIRFYAPECIARTLTFRLLK